MPESRITVDQLTQDLGQAIKDVLDEANDWSGTQRSRMVLDAAQAYRAMRGGAQPGSVHVEK